jgi:hypothetical protein
MGGEGWKGVHSEKVGQEVSILSQNSVGCWHGLAGQCVTGHERTRCYLSRVQKYKGWGVLLLFY